MALRIVFNGKQQGPKIKAAYAKHSREVLDAINQTAAQAAEEIETEGRADIGSAGNFGKRWTEGFTAQVGQGGGNIRISVNEEVPYWRVFQFGATIQGKPLLWIPLSFADDAQGISAKDYPGPLFRVDRKVGAPLLMTTGGQAKYFGKESVKIPKKFHLIEIVKGVARRMNDIYRSIRKNQQ
jgi:hypothetical protein